MYKHAIFFLLLFHKLAFSQNYIPPYNPSVDSITYNYNATDLKEIFNKPDFGSIHDYHNIAIDYAKILAPADSINKVFVILTNMYGIDYCDMVLQKSSWGEVVKNIFIEHYALQWSFLGKKCASIYASLDSSLIRKLVAVDDLDQKYRSLPNPSNSQMVQQLALDSINRKTVDSLIMIYGYVGKKLVGNNWKDVCWLVIQHSPIKYQKEQLKLIKNASKSGEMTKSNLAYTIDRIMLSESGVQKYGTQYYYDSNSKKNKPNKILDEKKVDQLRKEMDLPQLQYYIKAINSQKEN